MCITFQFIFLCFLLYPVFSVAKGLLHDTLHQYAFVYAVKLVICSRSLSRLNSALTSLSCNRYHSIIYMDFLCSDDTTPNNSNYFNYYEIDGKPGFSYMPSIKPILYCILYRGRIVSFFCSSHPAGNSLLDPRVLLYARGFDPVNTYVIICKQANYCTTGALGILPKAKFFLREPRIHTYVCE